MSTHTPAPWLIVEREVEEDGSVYPKHVLGGERLHQVCLLEAPNVAELAVKQPGSMWDTTPTKLANARLIAAAPELLEALKKAREWHLGDKYRFGDDAERSAWQQQLELYDAALVRVQGESP